MARNAEHNARYPAALGTALGAALLAAGGGFTLPAQANEPVKPAILAPVQPTLQVQKRAVAPRVVPKAALPPSATIAPDQIHKMVQLPLQPYTFEAEDWGELPNLGMSVQDMSGWGSQWSGNKQIFWNPLPPYYAFKWDFSAPGGQLLKINLTGAPDYADLTIRLGCYRQMSSNYYQLKSQHLLSYKGYASTVLRRTVTYPLFVDPQCKAADMFRLTFTATQSAGKTFGGIDSIEVTR